MKQPPAMSHAGALRAYLDTNALLEFRGLGTNDWLALFKEECVVLVISPVVIDELQRVKDGGGRNLPRRKRQRAGELLKSWEQELFPSDGSTATTVRVRDSVYLVYDCKATPADIFTEYSLDRSLSDGRLVGAVIAARKEGHRVCLASNDAGARWQAKSHGIVTFDLPDEWRIKEEPDDSERIVRELKAKVATLESRIPKLSLKPSTGPAVRCEVPKPREPISTHAAEEMEALRLTYGHYGKDPFSRICGLGANLVLPPTSQEIERYNAEIDEFFRTSEMLLPSLIAYQNNLDLYVSLSELILVNDGTQPAEKVSLVLIVPANLCPCPAPPAAERPTLPSPPERPRHWQEITRALSAPSRGLPHWSMLADRDSTFVPQWQIVTARATVSLGTLRHNDRKQVPPLHVRLPSYDEAKGFAVEYEIHAHNLPTPVTGKVNVCVTKGSRFSPLFPEKKEENVSAAAD